MRGLKSRGQSLAISSESGYKACVDTSTYRMLMLFSHVVHAAHNPTLLDERQANAVAARIELDLRIGAAFTRMQSMNLKPIVEQVQDVKVISYGTYVVAGCVTRTNDCIKRILPVSNIGICS